MWKKPVPSSSSRGEKIIIDRSWAVPRCDFYSVCFLTVQLQHICMKHIHIHFAPLLSWSSFIGPTILVALLLCPHGQKNTFLYKQHYKEWFENEDRHILKYIVDFCTKRKISRQNYFPWLYCQFQLSRVKQRLNGGSNYFLGAQFLYYAILTIKWVLLTKEILRYLCISCKKIPFYYSHSI